MIRKTLGLPILYLAAYVSIFSIAQAQEDPSNERIEEIIVAELPRWWEVLDLRIVATSDIGNAATPERVIRFEAEASPRATLYAETDRVGPFAIVVPTFGEDEKRTLYGVVSVRYRAGVWSGEALIENPVEGLGTPEQAFDGPVLVSGSDKMLKAMEALASQSVADFNRRLAEELERVEEEHARAAAKALEAHKQDIDRLQADAAAEIARIRAEADETTERAKAEESARVSKLVAELRETEEERALKEQLAERRRELVEASRRLEAAAAASAARRKEIVSGFAGTWTGRVDCRTSFLPWYTFRASYSADGGGALTGRFVVTAEATSRFAEQVGAQLPSTLTMLSQVGEPPILGVGTQGSIRNGLLNIMVQQQPDGRFAGKAGDDEQCIVQMTR